MRGWAVALSLALAVLTAGSAAAAPPGMQGFIRVSNGTFVDDGCQEYLPFGWNSWVSLNSIAADAAYSLPDGTAALDDNVQNDVVSLFQEAQTSGFNAVRLFAHGGDVNFQLQVSPGKYNESVFRGIDYILALAGKYQVKVMLYCQNTRVHSKYLAWAHIALEYQDTFWTSKEVRDMIKDHFSVVVNRRNMFTGKLYKEDDTIFAWDIYNEPRCPASQLGPGCPAAVTAFFGDLSAYLKSVDPDHMVTTGEEGFFELSSGDADADPSGIPANVLAAGRYWSAKIGQDFQAQHAFPSIDYTTIHLWPDNWETQDPDFPRTWIEAHERASAAMGKPLVLEEFGKGQGKNVTYQAVYDTLQDSLAQNGSFKGVLFWRWAKDDGNDMNTVLTGDPTFQLILEALAKVKPFMGRIVPGCTPKAVSAFG